MIKILENYPFVWYRESPVQISEGFNHFIGALGNTPGAPHGGVDYTRRKEDYAGKKDEAQYLTFQVSATHSGYAFSGEDKDGIGSFVMIFSNLFYDEETEEKKRFCTVYGHLKENHARRFKRYDKNQEEMYLFEPEIAGTFVKGGELIGYSGNSGKANGYIRLHFGLIQYRMVKAQWKAEKVDPYGVYGDTANGDYPQPGDSLQHLCHYWREDNPALAVFC